jgi:hypothetical protein
LFSQLKYPEIYFGKRIILSMAFSTFLLVPSSLVPLYPLSTLPHDIEGGLREHMARDDSGQRASLVSTAGLDKIHSLEYHTIQW